jgi:hypothetical protein
MNWAQDEHPAELSLVGSQIHTYNSLTPWQHSALLLPANHPFGNPHHHEVFCCHASLLPHLCMCIASTCCILLRCQQQKQPLMNEGLFRSGSQMPINIWLAHCSEGHPSLNLWSQAPGVQGISMAILLWQDIICNTRTTEVAEAHQQKPLLPHYALGRCPHVVPFPYPHC